MENTIRLLLKLHNGIMKLVTCSYDSNSMPLVLWIIIDFCLDYLFSVIKIVSWYNLFSCRSPN